MSKHRAEDPAGFPREMWEHPEVRESASAFWDGVVDFAEDGELSEAARDRLVRALRTLGQGLGAAVLVGAGPVALDAFQGDPTNVTGAASAFGTAALAAVVAYFHKRK
ncbi:hypothetical protein SMC26_39480 [Actinomadura fulvescens]|uniref:hypothetical protein n=1 Tax=Actinomadura fulvescens TaxID=46160 RepID=UPI0031D254EF